MGTVRLKKFCHDCESESSDVHFHKVKGGGGRFIVLCARKCIKKIDHNCDWNCKNQRKKMRNNSGTF